LLLPLLFLRIEVLYFQTSPTMNQIMAEGIYLAYSTIALVSLDEEE
jgi:hypothetical protein